MGKLKALLEWENMPLIQYQINQMKLAGVKHIHVILGYRKDDIMKHIQDEDVMVHWNESYESGRSSSIRLGAQHLTDDSVATFISSVDQPVRARTLRAMIDSFYKEGKSIVIPVHKERKGHPLLLGKSKFEDLRSVNEATEGLRQIIRTSKQEIHYVTVNDPSILYNFNTFRDYEIHRRDGEKNESIRD